MGVSKVYANGKTLIDLTADTISANVILKGYKGHNAAGGLITGTCTYDVDSSGATATASDILSGKKAAVKGAMVSGTCTYDVDSSGATATASDILSGKKAAVKGAMVSGTCTYDVDSSGATATASDILSGKKAAVKGAMVSGTCTYDVDSSGATAGVYDICKDHTAAVKGAMLTGLYEVHREQKSSSSTNCSTSQLVMDCPFKPKFVGVFYNASEFYENQVVACWVSEHTCVYLSYADISVNYKKIELVRTVIETNVSSYYKYKNGKVYIQRPNSSYSWASGKNYWVFAYK